MMLTVTKKQAHDSKKEKEQKKALKRVQRQTASEIKVIFFHSAKPSFAYWKLTWQMP